MLEWILKYTKATFLSSERSTGSMQMSKDKLKMAKAKTKLEEVLTAHSEPFFKTDTLCIFNEDFLKLNSIKENSIDLIVTSPPYDVDIKYETYDDNIPYDKYLEFIKHFLSKAYTLAKSDGRFCLNIPLDKNKGGQQSVAADITTIAKEVGWKYHSTIIWNEGNISRRTAWGSWLSARAPYVIAPVEVIVVLYKEKWKKTNRGDSDITSDEFIDWTSGVWNFNGARRKEIGHPAPFPIELPKRCIKLFSFVGDVVLDPFLGSGTTLLACLRTNRIGIGVEINKNYCELSKERVEKELELMSQKQVRSFV
jgi:site-specific DNA-methyltransferase (adenine-specific)